MAFRVSPRFLAGFRTPVFVLLRITRFFKGAKVIIFFEIQVLGKSFILHTDDTDDPDKHRFYFLGGHVPRLP